MLQLFIFYLLLLALQGVMSALFTVPSPDLFLIAAVSVLWHFRPWKAVLFAFCVGLIQDLVGHSMLLGVHAIGLAAAILVASIVATQIRQSGIFERLIIVFVALVAKWLMFCGLVVWFYNPNALEGILGVASFEIVFTVALSLIILPIFDSLMKRNGMLRREFL